MDTYLMCGKLGDTVPLMRQSPKQWIAESGLMLRVTVGSEVNGTTIRGSGDRDEMGICMEPPQTVIGSERFEHYQYRTQPEGVVSGPGDLDLIVYSLRKFVALATAGNPTVLTPLFVPDQHVLYANEYGQELREKRAMFLSRQVADKFAGYLNSQRQGLLGLRSGGTNNQGRADIREKYGFDTKFAMHMVRLGLQGVELLKTGAFTLPIPEPDLTWLRELREGGHTKEEALERAVKLERQIKALKSTSLLPEHPDHGEINRWLISMHRRFWGW